MINQEAATKSHDERVILARVTGATNRFGQMAVLENAPLMG